MAIRTITLTKVTNPFYPLPKIEFTQGETVTIRLTDSDTDLNNKLITFSIKEGLAIPGTNLSTNPNLIFNNQRIITVSAGFANFTIPNIDTDLLAGNKVYTLQIEVDLGSGTDYIYGTYELRVRESLTRVNILSDSSNLLAGTWSRGANMQSNGSTSDPLGTNTANSFTSLAAGNSFLYQSLALVPGATYRLSAQLKSSSLSSFFFRYRENQPSGLNIVDMTPITLTNTWQNISWTFTTVSPTINNNQIHILPPDRANGSEYSIFRPTLNRLS